MISASKPRSKAMTKSQYVKYVLLQLGGSIVDIELEHDIEGFVDLALLMCKPYIGTSKYMTLPAADSIDLSDKGVYVVVNVYRGAPLTSSGAYNATTDNLYNDAAIFNPGMLNYYQGIFNSGAVDHVAITLLTNQVINQVSGRSSDIDFTFDDDILYIESSNVGSNSITIEYIPDYQSVEEITEPFWINYILNIAVAKTKIALGRARGKYKVSGLPYEMDSDTLLNEGNSELERLQTKLEELSDTNYFLD